MVPYKSGSSLDMPSFLTFMFLPVAAVSPPPPHTNSFVTVRPSSSLLTLADFFIKSHPYLTLLNYSWTVPGSKSALMPLNSLPLEISSAELFFFCLSVCHIVPSIYLEAAIMCCDIKDAPVTCTEKTLINLLHSFVHICLNIINQSTYLSIYCGVNRFSIKIK